MNGLTDEEVVESRKKYGSNNVDLKNENKFIKLFFDALGDPIIKIMLIALAIRFILMFRDADWYETLGMLISILLSSLISSLSEYGSNKAFARLQSEYENIMVRVKRNNELTTVKCDDLVVGDIVYLESGEMTPADGVIIEGAVGVDEASINGEAKEVRKEKNAKLFKGSVILSDKCIMRIKNVGVNTIYGNIAKELNEKVPDSPMKIRLRKLAKIVSRIGYIGAILASLSYIFNVLFISNNFDLAVISEILKNPIEVFDIIIHTVTLAVTIIIVCVPEGLPMMLALVLSSNMKRMLKNNVLVRKPVGIETSGSISVLLTDKTGTLTEGVFEVQKVEAIGISQEELLKISAYSEYYSNHPISKSVKKAYGKEIDEKQIIETKELSGLGIFAKIEEKEVLIGNEKLMNENQIKFTRCEEVGTVLYVAINKKYAGYILIADKIKEDSEKAIKDLKKMNIKRTVMLTGDRKKVGEAVSQKLNIDNVYTELLPDGKVQKVEELLKEKSDKGKVAFVGDGINDAPVLALADIGIAMGGLGADSAIEAADIVIMTDEPSKIVNAIKLSKKTMRIVNENIIFAIFVKIAVLMLSALGLSTMWEAVFADVGVSVIAIINALRVLNVKK